MHSAATGGHDHSYQTEAGHFLQMTSSDSGPGAHKMAMLQLPPITYLPMGDYCFQLYYIRFGGVYTGSITLYVSHRCNRISSIFWFVFEGSEWLWRMFHRTISFIVVFAILNLKQLLDNIIRISRYLHAVTEDLASVTGTLNLYGDNTISRHYKKNKI